jgi:hypothetical protein
MRVRGLRAVVAAQLLLINSPVFAEPSKPICSIEGSRTNSWTQTLNLKMTVSINHPCEFRGYKATGAEIVSLETSSAKLGTVSLTGPTGWSYQLSDQFTVTVRTTRGVWTHIYNVTVQ